MTARDVIASVERLAIRECVMVPLGDFTAEKIVTALTAAGFSIVHESEIHGATRERCAATAKSFGDTWSGSRDVSVCVQEAAVDQKVDEIVEAIRALPDGGVE